MGTWASPELTGLSWLLCKLLGGFTQSLVLGVPQPVAATLLIGEGQREATSGQWKHSKHSLS